MISRKDQIALRNILLMVINDIKADEEAGVLNVLEASVQKNLCLATIAMLNIRDLGWRYPDYDA